MIGDDDERSNKDNRWSTNSMSRRKDSERNNDGGADDSDATEQCQEEKSEGVFQSHPGTVTYGRSNLEDTGPGLVTRRSRLGQTQTSRGHEGKRERLGTRLTGPRPTRTHSNALLTLSPLINRYTFTVHSYTVSRTMLRLLKKKNNMLLLLFKTDWVLLKCR